MYIYNDEDNVPMIDDPWMKYTTYSCKAEADAVESGSFDREQDRIEEARDMKRDMIRERFLDDLGFERKDPCRGCAWMKEGVIEQFEDIADDDLEMPSEAYDLAERMCAECRKYKEEERYDALTEFFRKEDEKW